MLKFIGKKSHNEFKDKVSKHLNTINTFFIGFLFLTPLIYICFHFEWLNMPNKSAGTQLALPVGEVLFTSDFSDQEFIYNTDYDRVAKLTTDDGGMCTSFLINTYTLLTSAHCVCDEEYLDKDEVVSEKTFWTNCKDNVKVSFTKITDPQTNEPMPSYQNLTATVGYYSPYGNADFALLNIDANLNIKPFKMIRSYDDEIDPRNTEFLGYGSVGDIEERLLESGTNYIEQYHIPGKDQFFQLQDAIVPGDSGGPILLEVLVDGAFEKQVLGIISYRWPSSAEMQDLRDTGEWSEERYDYWILFADKSFAQKVTSIITDPQILTDVWEYNPNISNTTPTP